MDIAAVILILSSLATSLICAMELSGAVEAVAHNHRYPWHTVSQAEFEQAAEALEGELPQLSEEERRFRLAQLFALIGDAHTLVPLLPLGSEGFCDERESDYLPLRTELFDDGLVVVGTPVEQSDLLGRRVLEIADRPVAEVMALAASALPSATPGFAREYVPEWLMSPDFIRAAGLADGKGVVPLRFEGAGSREVALAECRSFDWLHSRTDGPAAEGAWVHSPDPWGAFDGRLISSARIDGVAILKIYELRLDDRQSARAEFANLLRNAGAAAGPVIVDLRDTVGGDGTLIPALMGALEDVAGAQWAKRTAVLQARRTHSAGIMLLNELFRHDVRSFGQPTGDAPSHYGETQLFELPGLGAALLYASEFYDTAFQGDRRANVAPHTALPFSSEDFLAGRDPILDAARSHLKVN